MVNYFFDYLYFIVKLSSGFDLFFISSFAKEVLKFFQPLFDFINWIWDKIMSLAMVLTCPFRLLSLLFFRVFLAIIIVYITFKGVLLGWIVLFLCIFFYFFSSNFLYLVNGPIMGTRIRTSQKWLFLFYCLLSLSGVSFFLYEYLSAVYPYNFFYLGNTSIFLKHFEITFLIHFLFFLIIYI